MEGEGISSLSIVWLGKPKLFLLRNSISAREREGTIYFLSPKGDLFVLVGEKRGFLDFFWGETCLLVILTRVKIVLELLQTRKHFCLSSCFKRDTRIIPVFQLALLFSDKDLCTAAKKRRRMEARKRERCWRKVSMSGAKKEERQCRPKRKRKKEEGEMEEGVE